MEKDEEILLTVTLDEKATEARLKAIKTQMDFLRDAAKGLAKDLKDGVISQRQYNDALGRIDDQTAKLTKELTVQKKALDDSRKGIVANSGSLNEMSANAEAAKKEYLALTKAERDNEKVGGALLQRVQNLNKEYEEQNKKLTTTRKTLVDFVRDLEPFGVNLGETFDAFKASGQNIKGFVSGLGSIKGAIASTGVGLLLLALGALYTYLTKTQAGMDFLARKTAGVSAILQRLTGIVVNVGERMFKAFEEGRAGAALLDTVIESVTNRFKGLKVIAEGVINLDWRRIVDGFIQVGTGVTGATGKIETMTAELNKARIAAEKITLESQRIRDAEIKLNVERAKGQAQIEKLKKISEDTTKSTKERAAAAQAAYNLENSLLQRSIALQKQKIDNLRAEKKQGQDTVESRQAIAQEEQRLYEMIVDSTGKQTELQNNLNSIRQEGIDKAQAAEKKAAEESIARAKIALIQAKRNGEETLAIEELIIKQQTKADLVGVQGTQARLLILKQAEADILELRTNKAIETSARLINIKQSEIKALLGLVKEGTQAELELNKALIREDANQQKEQAKATITNKQELAAKLKEIDAIAKKAMLDADKAFLLKQVELSQKRAEEQQRISDILMGRFNADQAKRLSDEDNYQAAALARVKKGSNEEHKLILAGIERDRNRRIIAAKGNASELAKINAEANAAIEEENLRFSKQQVEKVLNYASQATSILDTLMSAQSNRIFAELDKQQAAAVKSAGANADLRERIEAKYAKKRAALEKEENERKQKYAEIQAIINGAVAVTEAAPNVLLMALAAAATLAQVALISSQQFADGGVAGFVKRYVSDGQGAYVHGPGSGTSDSISARISNGESIINAKSTAQFYSQLSAMNVAGGGRAFPGASQTPMPQFSNFSSGGLAAIPQAGFDASQLASMIEVGVAKALASQPPVLVTSDLHKVEVDQTRLNRRVTIS